MMKNEKKLIRSENRIIGGVCSSISEKYNVPLWILRTIFIISSIALNFLILIYLILWLLIPNDKTITQDLKKKKYSLQTIGFIIGGILGWFVGYGLGLIAIDGDKSGELVVYIIAFIGTPIGAIIGFSILRIIAEKRIMSVGTKFDDYV